MEIDNDHIIELIKGQATSTQAINDLKTSVEKGFTFLHGEHTKLDERVSSVEKKVWSVSSLGALLGSIAGYFGAGAFHK